MKRTILLLLALCVLLCGCSKKSSGSASTTPTGTLASADIDTNNLFSDRDLEQGYDEKSSISITLNGGSAVCDDSAVTISGGDIVIGKEGTYVLSGTLNDGSVKVNADKADKVQLVLKNATIHSQSSAPIYILQADKVFLTTADGTQNTLSNGGSFTVLDDNNIDGVIFSKEDLTMNGKGSLTIESPAGHGVVSKDELTITGGNFTITSASHGLSAKDSIALRGAAFDIAAGKDGIHAENNDDTAIGFVYIESGSYTITAAGDGISAASDMQIEDGTFTLLCGGGSENGEQHSSEDWGNMGGGGRPDGMGGGHPGGGMGPRSAAVVSDATAAADDSASIKGLKTGNVLAINGGTFSIDSADDAVHANGHLSVSGGKFTVQTGDDGFHADATLSIAGGTIDIQESYEGLEGLCIEVSGGDISIVSSDDGLNAAGGTDQSGFGGPRGDQFHSYAESDSYIRISGGKIFMNASGDGIDANGSLEITGGEITVCGPTNGDTAVLDYDNSGTISGGTFIGTGAYMMAQSLASTGNQGVIAVQVGSQVAGSTITLTDSGGNTVMTYAPNLPFQIVILSSPEIIKGETYTISVGAVSGEIEAS